MKNLYTIIVAEDDKDLNNLVQKTLQRENFQTECAHSGTDTIAKVADSRNTILLLDYELTDMKGKEVIETLTGRKCNVPFIVVTGQGNEQIAVEMMKLGAMDYIVKESGYIKMLPHVIKRGIEELAYKDKLAKAEENLLQEKQRLKEITDFMNCGVLLLDDQGRVAYANRNSEEWFGPFQQIKGKSCCEIFDLKDPEKECATLEVLRTGTTVRSDTFFKAVNGEDKYFYVVASPIKDRNGRINQITKVIVDITERKQAEQVLKGAHDELELRVKERTSELIEANEALSSEIHERKRIEKELLEIEEQERERMGRELHDDLGQLLEIIALKIELLGLKLKDSLHEEAENAAEIISFISQAKKKVRCISRGMLLLVRDSEGLMAALEELVSNTKRNFNVSCVFRCDRPFQIHNETAITHLYRIAQEAVTNSVRHGKPGHIEICLGRENEKIIMTVKDDGTGIPESPGANGMGLKIMQYRAGMISASLDVRADKNGGTLVTCIFYDSSGKKELS